MKKEIDWLDKVQNNFKFKEPSYRVPKRGDMMTPNRRVNEIVDATIRGEITDEEAIAWIQAEGLERYLTMEDTNEST